jgi:hypothetical protein
VLHCDDANDHQHQFGIDMKGGLSLLQIATRMEVRSDYSGDGRWTDREQQVWTKPFPFQLAGRVR